MEFLDSSVAHGARGVTVIDASARPGFHSNAGVVGLAEEVAELTDAQLDEEADLLAGIAWLDWPLAYHRRRLVGEEMARRYCRPAVGR